MPPRTPEAHRVTQQEMRDFNAMSPYVPTPPGSPEAHRDARMVIDSPTQSPPSYTAKEKGKGRFLKSFSPPPINFEMYMNQASPPQNATNKNQMGDFSVNPGSTVDSHLQGDMDGSIDKFLSLLIPYASPDIIMSPNLNQLNCVLYMLLRLLICVICNIAVQPSSLQHHRCGLPHADLGSISRTQILTLVAHHQL
jgi:hypothetical protein